VVIPSSGNPITITQTPTILPSENQIQVKVSYVSIEHIDKNQAATGAYINNYPFVLGKSFSGIIHVVGENVHDLNVGDEVCGLGYVIGAFQQYITLPRAHVCKVNPMSLEIASTLPHAFASSYTALFHSDGLHLSHTPNDKDKNAPIIVWGAAAATGFYAIQILRHFGYTKILAVASKPHFENLKKIGAVPFDRTQYDIIEALQHEGRVTRAFVAQADLEGLHNLFKATVEGTHIVTIIRLAPENVPPTHKFGRTVSVASIVAQEFGDPVISKHLADVMPQIVLGKNIKVLSEGKLLDRINSGFQQLGNNKEALVVKVQLE